MKMGSGSSIRICLSTGELEVAGDDEFIARFGDDVAAMLTRLRSQAVAPGQPGGDGGGEQSAPDGQSGSAKQPEFGEVLHGLPNGATGTDQILLAGYFAQHNSKENSFATGEANALLVEQGVKLSNPSQSLKHSLTAKRVFKVGSRYRISRTGEQHLQSLGALASR